MTKSREDSLPFTYEWPHDGIERIKSCPVCGNEKYTLLYDELEDIYFRCAPGKWNMHLCPNCGASFLNPRPSKDTIHLAYSKYYTHGRSSKFQLTPRGIIKQIKGTVKNKYIDIVYRNYYGDYLKRILISKRLGSVLRAKREIDRWLRHLPPIANQAPLLLDVGCGNGYFLKIAEDAGWDAIGVDFDDSALAIAKECGSKVLSSNIYSMPFASNCIDYVTMNHVIEHLHEPLLVLSEIKRVLKPKGILWIGTPNINSISHYRAGREWRGLEPPRHLIIFNLRALTHLLEEAGFVNICNRSIHSYDKENWELVMTAEKAL